MRKIHNTFTLCKFQFTVKQASKLYLKLIKKTPKRSQPLRATNSKSNKGLSYCNLTIV